MVLRDLGGAAGRIGHGLAMAGVGDARRALPVPAQRLEVVAERVGPRVRIQADRGRDPRQDRVAGEHDAVALEDDVTVGMARAEPRPASRRPRRPRRADGPGCSTQCTASTSRPDSETIPSIVSRGIPCERPVVGEELRVPLAPRQGALRVVDPPLVHRRARELGDVACAADVIRMHVRDHDRLDRSVERVEDRPPALLGIARAEPGVDEDEAPFDERTR